MDVPYRNKWFIILLWGVVYVLSGYITSDTMLYYLNHGAYNHVYIH